MCKTSFDVNNRITYRMRSYIANKAVSCDGSWHPWGHSSLNDVVTVVSVKNGKVLDVEAMSRVCKERTLNEELRIKDPEAYNIWKSTHICKLQSVSWENGACRGSANLEFVSREK